ncbi:hypothetical protein ACFST9_02005 [Hymenobacter monticola]|uniref:Uncharacterized protein n=1 Tax=Hymenobacter monticola TaxID=1705399 RepID=A0ABY4B290_9BACT|nr:hypothetical protein [Hymenobacter monticola]UOE33263.1 hypothetical protein MTP16_19325 [Hymenobacter monticola]
MALTGYQLQYKRRMKKALALRAKADRQARFLVARLATVLALGETAADHIGRINTLYGTNMSLRTDLVDGYRLAGTAAALNQVAGASLGGAPAAVFVNLPATSGDAMLPPDADLD